MPGPPDYGGVCRNCGRDEYVCDCEEADIVPAAEYYAVQDSTEGETP